MFKLKKGMRSILLGGVILILSVSILFYGVKDKKFKKLEYTYILFVIVFGIMLILLSFKEIPPRVYYALGIICKNIIFT